MLGAEAISSFEDTSEPNAETCANIYPEMVKGIMARYPWRFLMKQKALTESGSAPVNKWAKAFVLPPDMLALPHASFMSSGDKLATSAYEIFGSLLYTDHAEIYAEYTAHRAEAYWPHYFRDLIVAAMAAQIAFVVTDQQSTQSHWQGVAFGTPSDAGEGGLYALATVLDAQGQGQNSAVFSDAFLDARMGGYY